MTSLARQLKNLTVPQTTLFNVQDKIRNSLIFDPKEAANFDKEIFFSLGVNGLQELELIDPNLIEYEENLFGEVYKTKQRVVEDIKFNKHLNELIKEYLIKLSPYFMLKPSLQTLEWLVYRYHIHLLNQDELMLYALPYHNTNYFVRIIQLFDFKNTKSNWAWLKSLQKTGLPLNKIDLFKQILNDNSFLKFIGNMPLEYIKIYKNNSQLLKTIFSFYTSTIIGAINISGLSENFISTLAIFIEIGLKSEITYYNLSTHMIICSLSNKIKLKIKFWKTIVKIMSQNIRENIFQHTLLCLINIINNQPCQPFTSKSIENLYLNQTILFCNTLNAISSQYDTSIFVTKFGQALIKAYFDILAICDNTLEMDISKNTNRNQKKMYGQGMMKFLKNIILSKQSTQEQIIKFCIDNYIKACQNNPHLVKSNAKTLAKIFNHLDKRYPKAMETVLSTYFSESFDSTVDPNGDAGKKALRTLVKMVTSPKYMILDTSNTTLHLSLNHFSKEIRCLAVDTLVKSFRNVRNVSIETNTHDDKRKFQEYSLFVKQSLRDKLKFETEPSVLKRLFTTFRIEEFKSLFLVGDGDGNELFRILLTFLQSGPVMEKKIWLKIYKKALYLLAEIGAGNMAHLSSAPSSLDEEVSGKNRNILGFFVTVLPYLYANDDNLKLLRKLSCTDWVKNFALFRSLDQSEWRSLLTNKYNLRSANETLIACVTKDILASLPDRELIYQIISAMLLRCRVDLKSSPINVDQDGGKISKIYLELVWSIMTRILMTSSHHEMLFENGKIFEAYIDGVRDLMTYLAAISDKERYYPDPRAFSNLFIANDGIDAELPRSFLSVSEHVLRCFSRSLGVLGHIYRALCPSRSHLSPFDIMPRSPNDGANNSSRKITARLLRKISMECLRFIVIKGAECKRDFGTIPGQNDEEKKVSVFEALLDRVLIQKILGPDPSDSEILKFLTHFSLCSLRSASNSEIRDDHNSGLMDCFDRIVGFEMMDKYLIKEKMTNDNGGGHLDIWNSKMFWDHVYLLVLNGCSNPHESVRKSALRFSRSLANISNSAKTDTLFESYSKLASKIIKKSDQICKDKNAISQFLRSKFSDDNPVSRQILSSLASNLLPNWDDDIGGSIRNLVVDIPTVIRVKIRILEIFGEIGNDLEFYNVFCSPLFASVTSILCKGRKDDGFEEMKRSILTLFSLLTSKLDVRIMGSTQEPLKCMKSILDHFNQGSNEEDDTLLECIEILCRTMTREIFNSIPDSQSRCQLFEALLKVNTGRAGHSNLDERLGSILASNPDLISDTLKPMVAEAYGGAEMVMTESPAGIKKIRKSLKLNKAKVPIEFSGDRAVDGRKDLPKNLTRVLEILCLGGAMDADNIQSYCDVVMPICFHILDRYNETTNLRTQNDTHVAWLALKQLTMITSHARPHLVESRFNMAILLSCLRTVDQSEHGNTIIKDAIFDVLKRVVPVFSERITHNVVSLFTFMGNAEKDGMVRDDKNTFDTIYRVIDVLVPELVRHLSNDLDLPLACATFSQIFSDAVLHIPSHRRFPLFHKLAQVLASLSALPVSESSALPTENMDDADGSSASLNLNKTPDDATLSESDIKSSAIATSETLIRLVVFLYSNATKNLDNQAEIRQTIADLCSDLILRAGNQVHNDGSAALCMRRLMDHLSFLIWNSNGKTQTKQKSNVNREDENDWSKSTNLDFHIYQTLGVFSSGIGAKNILAENLSHLLVELLTIAFRPRESHPIKDQEKLSKKLMSRLTQCQIYLASSSDNDIPAPITLLSSNLGKALKLLLNKIKVKFVIKTLASMMGQNCAYLEEETNLIGRSRAMLKKCLEMLNHVLVFKRNSLQLSNETSVKNDSPSLISSQEKNLYLKIILPILSKTITHYFRSLLDNRMEADLQEGSDRDMDETSAQLSLTCIKLILPLIFPNLDDVAQNKLLVEENRNTIESILEAICSLLPFFESSTIDFLPKKYSNLNLSLLLCFAEAFRLFPLHSILLTRASEFLTLAIECLVVDDQNEETGPDQTAKLMTRISCGLSALSKVLAIRNESIIDLAISPHADKIVEKLTLLTAYLTPNSSPASSSALKCNSALKDR
ncbi:uncharacterized protein LOC135928874, partial [Gordionus sp. m RMFG-2023]|uniref:uncharacterized protein LOC135928874 n=1 Tax=Gordionus sp. m RMFG-2023 TaxID=3053472 RepID=UPI0031FD5EFE